MANKRITELNTHTSPQLSDLIAIVNSNETKKIAYGTLYYGIRDGLVSGSSQITLGDVTNFTSYSSSVDSILTNLVNATSSYLTSETDSQTLSIVGDQLTISNGNTVTIPTGSELPSGLVSGSSQITLGGTNGFTEFSSSLSASIAAGTNEQDLSNYALISGGNEFIGDQTISGSLFVSGGTELGGDIFPQTPQGARLGTPEKPFREIYLQSGSISIESSTPGDPSAVLSNNDGNLDISVGGMRLIESGNSFIAETGSFAYISGSLTQQGDYTRFGDTIAIGNFETTGSLKVSGSTIQIGDNTLIGKTSLTGSVNISGSLNTTGSSVFGGDVDVQGDFYHKGNKQYNYGQFYSLQTQSGSANTAYAMKYEVTDGTSGVSITDNVSGFPTRITPTNTGVYNIQFSTQLGNTANSDITFDIWFRINEVNVSNSNTKFSLIKSLGSGLYAVAALNFLTQLNAGQYVEIMWSCGASTGQFEYLGTQSTPTRPATPSIILTVTQIS